MKDRQRERELNGGRERHIDKEGEKDGKADIELDREREREEKTGRE